MFLGHAASKGKILYKISFFKALWPQTTLTLKVYPKPSHMMKSWSQLDSWELRYRAASIIKNFFSRCCVTKNIMDPYSISTTFPYGKVLVSIGQLGLRYCAVSF